MIAAGSPGASRSKTNTNTTTTAMTGNTARTRRTAYASTGERAQEPGAEPRGGSAPSAWPRLLLGHVPEQHVRRGRGVLQVVLAPLAVRVELAHRDVREVFHQGRVILGQELLEVRRAGCGVAQIVEGLRGPRRARPAEPGALAERRDVRVPPGIHQRHAI